MDLTSITGIFLHISIDWIFLASLGLLALLDGMRGGSSRSVALGLAFPLVYILARFSPAAQLMGSIEKGLSSPIAQGLFAVVLLVFCFLMLYRVTDTFVSDGGFIQAFAGALGLIAMVGLFWPLIPGLAALHTPDAQFLSAFSEAYRFWWLLVGLAAVAFSR
ncbi:MAG TPA: hypothetical protein VHD38_03350 [Candidatus Paceibacterota bacterium]|nr:hypothetical protein [Candidatus Paceibacterota bacterium]